MKYSFEPLIIDKTKYVSFCINISLTDHCISGYGLFIRIQIYKLHLFIRPIGSASF